MNTLDDRAASTRVSAVDKPESERELTRLAEKYIWWTPPERVVSEGFPRLVAQVMELGTWEDANALIACVGEAPFLAVLDAPPPGVVSDKSLAFWHIRLGRAGERPRARRRFG